MKKFIVLAIVVIKGINVWGQTTEQTHATPPDTKPKATNVLEAFEHGHLHGHFRSFFMATDNEKQLSDYHALAIGGGLHFSTAAWHGFSFGLGGIFNYNLKSSDLSVMDSSTGAPNRYEIGLFDVEDPHNRNDLDRIEELWLRYQWNKSSITIGQQSIQTPLINYQDGRMRPTAEAGIWGQWNYLKNTKVEGGWLWKISPRSTVKWYNVGESIGLYPKGLNPDGTTSGYPEQLESKGIALLGITRKTGKNLKVQIWNQYVDNIFNTVLLQSDYALPLKNGQKLLFGLQLIHQDALANGGNESPSKTYFQKNGQSNTLSTQMGWKNDLWQALLAYTRITAQGRFLSPREWGREPFYTFMPRERVEGSGDVHAVTGRVSRRALGKKLLVEAGYGYFHLPNVSRAAVNKYAFPAFQQVNFDIKYTFSGMLDGLNAQLLYVWKGRLGNVNGNDRLTINRVNMSQYNIIFNYAY